VTVTSTAAKSERLVVVSSIQPRPTTMHVKHVSKRSLYHNCMKWLNRRIMRAIFGHVEGGMSIEQNINISAAAVILWM
jgi:hypothetical protein